MKKAIVSRRWEEADAALRKLNYSECPEKSVSMRDLLETALTSLTDAEDQQGFSEFMLELFRLSSDEMRAEEYLRRLAVAGRYHALYSCRTLLDRVPPESRAYWVGVYYSLWEERLVSDVLLDLCIAHILVVYPDAQSERRLRTILLSEHSSRSYFDCYLVLAHKQGLHVGVETLKELGIESHCMWFQFRGLEKRALDQVAAQYYEERAAACGLKERQPIDSYVRYHYSHVSDN